MKRLRILNGPLAGQVVEVAEDEHPASVLLFGASYHLVTGGKNVIEYRLARVGREWLYKLPRKPKKEIPCR